MRMEEKLIQGGIAGLIAGTLKDIPDAVLHYGFNITKLTFWDYAGTLALGRHPQSFLEHAYSFGYEVIFSILLGTVFALLLNIFKAKRYLLWGGFYGAIVWFAVRGAVVGLNIKPLMNSHLLTSAVNSLDSVLYGMMLGFIIKLLLKKSKMNVIAD